MRYFLLCALWLLSSVIVAQEVKAVPFARLVAESDSALEVGGALYVRYEVWVPSWFFGSPSFPDDLSAKGALSEMIKGSPTSEFRDIGDQRWTGLIRRYRVTPLQLGKLDLQPAAVDVRYAGEGAQARQMRISVVEPLSMTATLPPGAKSLKPFVAAGILTLAQTVAPSGVEIRVGDIVERTVSLMTDSQSPSLSGLPLGPPDGPGIYTQAEQIHSLPAKPSTRPLIERVVSTSFLMDTEGERWLPEIDIDWWDLHARRLRKTQLPALRIDVLPALPQVDPFRTDQASTAGSGAPQLLASLWSWGLLLTAVGTLLLLRGKQLRGALTSLLLWMDTELWYRLRLLHACRQNDAAEADAALRCWLGAIASGREAQLLGDPALLLERGKLDKYRFACQASCEPWIGLPLYRATCRARKNWRRSVRRVSGKRLPSLSP